MGIHRWNARNPTGRRIASSVASGTMARPRLCKLHVRARLLGLVPGRSGVVYADWLKERNQAFRDQVKVAILDPFQGCKNAIDDELEDAKAVLDAFYVAKLGTDAVDDVRRRVQRDTFGHRGRKGDPLYSIATILRCNADRLSPTSKRALLAMAIAAHDAHEEVSIAWQAAQPLRNATPPTT